MASIVTLTLSPALDCATSIERLSPDAKLRCSSPSYAPGGGGINVARAIHRLGGRALALFPAGGPSGQHVLELLDAEGVAWQMLPAAAWTRECLNFLELASNEQYRLVLPGASLSLAEQAQLLQLLAALPAFDYLVISGSMPVDLAADFLAQVLHCAQLRGARCILDSAAPTLRQGLDVGGLWLIKPNLRELSALLGVPLGDPRELAELARGLLGAGRCEALLVSLGAQGALLVCADGDTWIEAPVVPKRSSVGAGDSLLGAMLLKLAAGASWLEAAQYGVAAGSAAIMAEGTQLCAQGDTERLFAQLQAQAGS
jgi:6-phosphofructokinase 2